MIRSVGVLYQDNFGGPPTAVLADAYWDRDTMFEIVADIEQDCLDIFPNDNVSARAIVIDTRDMTIFHKQAGHDQPSLVAAVNELAAAP